MPLNTSGMQSPGVAGVPASGTQSQQTTQMMQPAIPPQMQALQAQLAQLQQAGTQPNVQAMQSVMGMMGPGANVAAPPPNLGALMQPMGPSPIAQSVQQLAAPAASAIMSPAQLMGR